MTAGVPGACVMARGCSVEDTGGGLSLGGAM
jgi:hypothetical protein